MKLSGKFEYERVKKYLWSGKEFKLSCLLLPNGKTTTGNLRHGFYERSYESRKYNDRHELTTLDISVGEYYLFEFVRFEENGGKLSSEILISHNKLLEVYTYFNKLREILTVNYNDIYTQQGANENYAQSSPQLQNTRDNEVKSLTAIPVMMPHPSNPATAIPGVYFIVGTNQNCGTYIAYDNFINLCSMIVDLTGSSATLSDIASNTLIEAQNNLIIDLLSGGGAPVSNNFGGSNVGRRPTNSGFNRSSVGTPQPRPFTNNAGNGITNHTPAGNTGTSYGRPSAFPTGMNVNRAEPLRGAPVPTQQPPVNNVPEPQPTNTVTTAPEIEKTSLDEFANELNGNVETESVVANGGFDDILKEASNVEFDLEKADIDEDLDL